MYNLSFIAHTLIVPLKHERRSGYFLIGPGYCVSLHQQRHVWTLCRRAWGSPCEAGGATVHRPDREALGQHVTRCRPLGGRQAVGSWVSARCVHCVLIMISVSRFVCDPFQGPAPQSCLWPWGFSRQENWSGLPCPPPGDLPNPRIEHMSPAAPALQVDSLPLSHILSAPCSGAPGRSRALRLRD